jgi:hypothetical protein
MASANPRFDPAKPIAKQIATWTNLDAIVDVEDLMMPAGSLIIIQRSFREVKASFESPNKSTLIVCPRLRPVNIPKSALDFSKDRNNNEEVLRRYREDPYWLCQAVLAQEGALQLRRYRETDSWIMVEQGSALVTTEGVLVTPEDRASFDSDPKNFKQEDGRPMLMLIREGDMTIIPALTIFTIYYNEDTLLSMGNIVPHRNPARA